MVVNDSFQKDCMCLYNPNYVQIALGVGDWVCSHHSIFPMLSLLSPSTKKLIFAISSGVRIAFRRLGNLTIQRLLRLYDTPPNVCVDLALLVLLASSSSVVRNVLVFPAQVGGHQVREEALNVMCHGRIVVETQLLHLGVFRPGGEGNLDIGVSIHVS